MIIITKRTFSCALSLIRKDKAVVDAFNTYMSVWTYLSDELLYIKRKQNENS